MKTCKKCKEEKHTEDFQDNPKNTDGKHNNCRKCRNAFTIEWQRNNKARAARYTARWKKKHPQAVRAAVMRWQAKNPIKRAAHRLVEDALRRGQITKTGCEVCSAVKVDGHHPDYSKPLDVRWLCRKHHKEAHLSIQF